MLMKTVEERRLKEVRLWILANTIIFLVTAPSLHYYRWERMDYKGQAAIVIQSALQVPITIALVASFLGHLQPVYPLVLLQGIQTILYNYLSFDKSDTQNFLVDNIVLSVISSIFVIFNSYLYCRIV